MTKEFTPISKYFVFFWACLWLGAIHYFQYNSGGSGLEIPSSNMTWCFVALLIASCCYRIIQQKELTLSKTTWFFIASVCLMSLPYLYPENWFADELLTAESAGRGLGLVAGLLFFIALQQVPKTSGAMFKLSYIVLFGIAIEAIFILGQFFLLTENNWLNYNIEYRPYGVFQQVNVAASFMATGVALSLYLLLQQSRQDSCNSYLKITLLACSLICPLAVMLTQSRAGTLGLGVVMILGYLGSYSSFKSQLKLRNIWLGLMISGILLGMASIQLSKTDGRSLEQVSSMGIRKAIYTRSFKMVTEHPVLGWGYGNFEWSYLNHQAKAYTEDQNIALGPDKLEHPHNELLYWAVEGGLVSVVGIFLLMAYFFWQLRKSKQKLIFLALFAPLAIHCMLELPFYHAASPWILFIFLIWLTDHSKEYSFAVEYTFALRALTPILVVCTMLFMLTNLHTLYLVRKFDKTKATTLFSQVINPIGLSDMLTSYNLIMRYNVAISTGNKEDLNQFLSYMRDWIKYEPRPVFYKMYAGALLALKQEDYAKYIAAENNYLFPQKQMRIENGQLFTEKE
ncbi:PglL family O-oligosaccharyltransferase [Desulfotalea psychrophila]|nr:Wzy polymerase domain-containing protein [Desulfotalea psychrophila]